MLSFFQEIGIVVGVICGVVTRRDNYRGYEDSQLFAVEREILSRTLVAVDIPTEGNFAPIVRHDRSLLFILCEIK